MNFIHSNRRVRPLVLKERMSLLFNCMNNSFCVWIYSFLYFPALFQCFYDFRQHCPDRILILCSKEVAIYLRFFIRGNSVLNGRFGQRMDSDFFTFCYTCKVKHHCTGSVSDHHLSFFSESLDDFHQVHIVWLVCILLEYRYCISTGEYKCIKFVFMPF